jgi:hypothetical protein
MLSTYMLRREPWLSFRRALDARALKEARLALAFALLLGEGRQPADAAREAGRTLGEAAIDVPRLTSMILDAARDAGLLAQERR